MLRLQHPGSSDTPAAQTQAIAADAAGQLGVSTADLTAAIKKAMVDQIEAQVTAGTLTKAQATAIEARLAKADAPLFALGGGPGGRGGPDHRGGPGGGPIALDAAATYIGISASDLRTQLDAGKTLAAIATANGKTVDGLKAALTTAAKTDLDAAVTAGRLTQAQEDKILADLPARLDHEVNEVHTGGPGARRPGRPSARRLRRGARHCLTQPASSPRTVRLPEPRQATRLRGSVRLRARVSGRLQLVRPTSRVLIVDDDAGVRRMLARSLEAEGYAVALAADGGGALVEIERSAPT